MPFKTYSRTYQAWMNMKARCKHPDRPGHQYWKDVTICERWLSSYKNFLEDMGEAPKGMTLDRIEGAKLYSKETCRWADRATQTKNRTLSKKPLSGHRYITKERGRKDLYCIKMYGQYKQVISCWATGIENAVELRDFIIEELQSIGVNYATDRA